MQNQQFWRQNEQWNIKFRVKLHLCGSRSEIRIEALGLYSEWRWNAALNVEHLIEAPGLLFGSIFQIEAPGASIWGGHYSENSGKL